MTFNERGAHITELFNLSGRVAMVTGGAQNLGLDMARALGEAGADLLITSRDAHKAQTMAKKMQIDLGVTVTGIGMDVTDEASVAAGFDRLKKEFDRLDVLVLNAGGARLSGGTPYTEGMLVDDWDYVMKLNLHGTFLPCRYALPIMQQQKSGSIITVGSISGMVGRNRSVYAGSPDMVPNMTSYSAAKGGVIQFTRDLAAEQGRYGIRVNAISPGGFERGQPEDFIRRYNEQTMLGRMGRDGVDLKGAVVFLASDASAYITGHNLPVDGGFTAW